MHSFSLTNRPLEPGSWAAELHDAAGGGLVTFEGRVRDHNRDRPVIAIEYEAYPELARSEGLRIVEEACERFGLCATRCVHRTGHLRVGDSAVWVGVLAPHRQEAFEACRYIIDELKERLPVWKREHYGDGPAQWIGDEPAAET